jgi:hypothetical protein
VVCVNKAVADRSGAARFTPDDVERGFLTQADEVGGETVDAVSLDDFFTTEGWSSNIAFVKIDIEGGERAALAGMKELCRKNPTVRLIMEYNQAALKRAGETEERLGQTLNALGMDRGQWIERGLEPFKIDGALPRSRTMYNVLIDGSHQVRAKSFG